MNRQRTIAAAMIAAFLLAGCGGSPSTESTPSPSTSVTPSKTAAPAATGMTITGTEYRYQVPQGWGPPATSNPNVKADSIALDLADSDGFPDNVLVMLVDSLTAAQAEEAARSELSANGITDITINKRIVVAGRETAHVSATATMNDRDFAFEQFWPTNGDRTYVVSFTISPPGTSQSRELLTASVLNTWEWTG